MNESRKIMLANASLQLLIINKKLEICETSHNNTRHFHADLLNAEKGVLITLINELENN